MRRWRASASCWRTCVLIAAIAARSAGLKGKVVTIVVVDTNILVESPRLRKPAWMSLVAHAEAWGVRIVVPEVVFMETVNVVRRRWKRERDALAGLKLGEFDVADHLTTIVAEIERQADEYETWLRNYLDQHGIQVEPIPPIDHMDVARRASSGRTPFTRNKDGNTKDGYRDTLIWLTLVPIALDNVDEEVWLVSHNIRDFGSKRDDRAGADTGDGEEANILFHPELADELAEAGLSGRVRYTVNAERLEQHLAAQYAPITGTDLAQRVKNIRRDVLASLLVDILVGTVVDPESAALPIEVVNAEVVGAREPSEEWEFTEAAGRGDGGWTARFAVDTKVDISLVSVSLVVTKALRIFGQITVAGDGETFAIAVDSVEALPGDPMRARWTRRAQVEALTSLAGGGQLGGTTTPLGAVWR